MLRRGCTFAAMLPRSSELPPLHRVRAESAIDWAPLFDGDSSGAAELRGLDALGIERQLSHGELVFSRRQRAEHLVAVISGSVGLGLARDGSPFHLQRSVHGPQWVDLSSAWLDGPYGQDAVALSKARLVELPWPAVRELLHGEPALAERLLLSLARQVQGLNGLTHDLMHKDAERRLAVWLCQHCQGSDAEVIVPLKERKRDIAAQLAITPETLSRLLRQLQRKGVLAVRGYTVQVLDLPALQTLAQD